MSARDHIRRAFDPKNADQSDDQDAMIIKYDKIRPWNAFLRFLGPGYLLAVGYIDPGNWATDIGSGARFGYRHLFVILLSNVFAVLFQILCIRLGVITGADLAQQCRNFYPRKLNWLLYALAEISIIATDLAEVIGSAIALKLLFNIPLIWGVLITGLDVMLVLKFWGSRYQRYYEFIVFILIIVVMACFSVLLSYTKPSFLHVLEGYLPTLELVTNPDMLYFAVSIIGATVMPHNLYLHSSICKNRRVFIRPDDIVDIMDGDDIDVKSNDDQGAIQADAAEKRLLSGDEEMENEVLEKHIDKAVSLTVKYSIYDTVIALTFAFVINSTILIVGASAFSKDHSDVQEIEDAYAVLKKYVGTLAATCFAIALLLSGQTSSVTGTMAGEIVMSGFLDLKIKPALRRFLTRCAAIIPAIVTIIINGEKLDSLLLLSQAVLSAQLPFAVFPLIHLTSSRKLMAFSSRKNYASGFILTSVALLFASLITVLNVFVVYSEATKSQ